MFFYTSKERKVDGILLYKYIAAIVDANRFTCFHGNRVIIYRFMSITGILPPGGGITDSIYIYMNGGSKLLEGNRSVAAFPWSDNNAIHLSLGQYQLCLGVPHTVGEGMVYLLRERCCYL